MVFDEDQNTQGGGASRRETERQPKGQRGGHAGTAAAAAGAAGAGLGAGAAAGIVGGEDAVDFIRAKAGQEVDEGRGDLADIEARIEAAQTGALGVASSASFDVFDGGDGAADAASEASDIASAASLIGDALPPSPEPASDPAPAEDRQPTGNPLIDGNPPTFPGGVPATGRPRQEQTQDTVESEAPVGPDAESSEAGGPSAESDTESDDAAPSPPPTFSVPPSPSTGGSVEDDEIVSEAPAPGPGPSPAPASGPGSSPAPTPAPVASDSGASEGSASESPSPGLSSPPSTGAPSFSDDPDEDESSASDAPASETETDAGSSEEPAASASSGSSGSSSEAAPPPASSSSGSSEDSGSSSSSESPDTGPPVSSADSETSGSDESSAGSSSSESSSSQESSSSSSSSESSSSEESSSSGSSSESSYSRGSDSAPIPTGPGSGSSSGSDSGSSSTYPYIYQWDDEGEWVDVAMQNDYGQVYHLRYHEDGGVYAQNDYGQWEQIEGENLPHLLYVDEHGVAYFTKVQYQHNVYFSLDSSGDFDWVEYDDIPGYEPPHYDDDYDYPRVIDHYYGDDGWALVQLEDGSLVKYYEDGGAYWVDEYGNETAATGYQVPTLLHVDNDGDAYFRVYNESGGYYQYYTVDNDGGVEYIHDYDVPGYQEPPVEDDYEYPRVTEWDAGEGWVIIQNGEGAYAKIYQDGAAYEVDEYGEPVEGNGAYYYPELLYVDEYGNAYFRTGEEGYYEYLLVDHDGGLEYVEYDDVPVYQEDEDYEYPRVVEYYEGDPDWAVLEDQSGQLYKIYGDEGGAYEVHPDGSETPVTSPYHLISVDGYGNAYFYSYNADGNLQYHSVDGAGGMEYIDPYTIPDYDVPEDYEAYDYPRVMEWDYDEGWVGIQGEDGYLARYYLDGYEAPVDQNGNPITNGQLPFDGDLLYMDQNGNAYFRAGEEGAYTYFHIDDNGGMQYVDPNQIPGYELPEEEAAYDYPRVAEWDYDDGWVIVQDEDGYYVKYYDDGSYQHVDEYGNQIPPAGPGGDGYALIHVDPHGNAYFRSGEEGNYNYYILDEQGHAEYIQYEDIPGYGNEDLEDGEYEYPRSVQWDTDDGWVIIESEPGTYIKYYEYRPPHFVDEDGNEIVGSGTPAGAPLVQVDQYGNAYFQGVGPDGYEYMVVGYGGGYEPVDAAAIPDYDDPQEAYEEPQVQVVQWDAGEGWAVIQDPQGYLIKLYENGDAYYLDPYGNELPINDGNFPTLVQIEANGNAYVQYGNPPNYSHQVVYADGGYANIDEEDIPIDGADGDYDYPRTLEWNAGDGWVIVEDANGDYIKFYEDRPPHYVDADGNELPGAAPISVRLVQVDEYGNAYFQGADGGGGDDYIKIDPDGGTEAVAVENIPDYEPGEYNPDYGYPRVLETDPNAGWALLEIEGGYQVKFYENGDAYFVDSYGNETPVGDYPLPDLLRIDEQGYAYMRFGEGPDYTYYQVDYDGGYQDIAFEDIPGYEDLEQPGDADVVDGYLPDGAPDYFGDPMWVNPEADPRFVLYQASDNEDGEYYRTYVADLDGNGTVDYAIMVREYPDGRLEIAYSDGATGASVHKVEIVQDESGTYQDYQVTEEGNPADGVPLYDELAENGEENAEQAAYDLLPDTLPAELAGGYPNPEVDPDYYFSHMIPGAGGPFGQGTYMFYNGDGTQTIAVVAGENGNTVVYWLDGYVESPFAVNPAELSGGAMMTIDANGQYELSYWDPNMQNWSETPPVVQQDGYDYDGYLPDGTPEYFGDPMWVNPELDQRFELYDTNEDVDYTSRIYRADLDGDGNHDYQIIVNEYPDGSVGVQYYDDYQAPASAVININQDEQGNYHGYVWDYGQDTQGVPLYYGIEDDAEPGAGEYNAQYVYDLLHDDLPARFYGSYVNPEQDADYVYHHSTEYADGVSHVFDAGGMSVVVQEHADGTQTLYWHDEPAGALTPPYVNGAEARAEVYGNGQYNMEYWYDGQWVADPPDNNGELGADYDIDGYIPEAAGAYFVDERWPNPQDDERFEMTNQTELANGGYARVYNADLTGDGVWDYQVTVIEYPDGQTQVEYSGANGLEARIELDQYGAVANYQYYGDNPMGVAAYEGQEADGIYEADGYLPQGAPDYFDDDRWPNPEQDDRFEMTNGASTPDGGYARVYNADLSGDGIWDYQVTVIEHPNGTVQIEYSGANGLEAEYQLVQDAGGYYQSHQAMYYSDEPYGALPEYYANGEDPGEQDEDAPQAEVVADEMMAPDYVFYGLPAYFTYDGMTYPSPLEGDWVYEGLYTVGGVNVHQFSQGNYTVMVQDSAGGDRVIYVNDHSTGSNIDVGYILRADGTLEVHPEWAPAETAAVTNAGREPQEEAPLTEASGDDAGDEQSEEDLQFATEEEEQQLAEEAGEDALEFNGPEAVDDQPDPEPLDEPEMEEMEEIEPVEIAEPELVEATDAGIETFAADPEEDIPDEAFDDDDNGSGL